MKYPSIFAALLFLAGTLGVANAQISPRLREPPHGSGCPSNPYAPGHTLGCNQGEASAKNKKTVHPKAHVTKSVHMTKSAPQK